MSVLNAGGSVPSAKQEASLNGKGDALDVDIEQMNKQLQQQMANFENDLYGDQTWTDGDWYSLAPTMWYDENRPRRGKGNSQRKLSRASIFQ